MNILIIGGTRNIGYFLAKRILQAGHKLTLLNRGITPDDLPESIARLHCDRGDFKQMQRALGGRDFDVVIDMTLFKGQEAEDIINILDGHVGHYIFISTGQVYLIRDGVQRPFKESDYAAPVMPAPEPNTYDYEEWLYGKEKSNAEDALANAYAARNFPYTSLRLPMVNSERDGFNRLFGYVLRIKDGGPILVPTEPTKPLRHVYAGDVVEAIMTLIETGKGKGSAYNISQDETMSLEAFLGALGDVIGNPPNIVRVERTLLDAHGFLPDCSPFSDAWMSELDNTLSKQALGISYTPVRDYLQKIVAYYDAFTPKQPTSYRRRHAEKLLVAG